MTELKLILASHFKFYLRHPFLSLMFILGLSLGTALISAIQGLNSEASDRYQQASNLAQSPVKFLIKPPFNQEYLSQNLWNKLRQAGITSAQPVLEGFVSVNNRRLLIKGVNTLQWFSSGVGVSNEENEQGEQAIGEILLDPSVIDKLSLDKTLKIDKSKLTLTIGVVPDLGPWALLDIGLADTLITSELKGKLSFIEIGELSAVQRKLVEEIVGSKGRLTSVESQEFDHLAGAFFFNLSAMAMLGYAVGLFLSINALKLTLSARQKMREQMFTLGCSIKSLNVSVGVELLFISLVTAFAGNSLGFILANGLVLDINTTLINLYQLDRALTASWQWQPLFIGFALNLVALTLVLFSYNVKFSNWFNNIKPILAGLLIVFSTWLYFIAESKVSALLLCATVMLLFILATPALLNQMLNLKFKLSHPLMNWLKMSSKQHLSDVSVSIFALQLAFGAAIGTQVMVSSFSKTLNLHLQQRLLADVYVRPEQPNDSLRQQLSQLPYIDYLSIYQASEGSVDGLPASLASYGSNALNYRHIKLTNNTAVDLSHITNGSCLINEPASLKYGLKVGKTISFSQTEHQIQCKVSGIYYDYGNQKVALLIDEFWHDKSQLAFETFGYSIKLNDEKDSDALIQQLKTEFAIPTDGIIVNSQFKKLAQRLFADTFSVTHALNTLMILIALIGIWVSFMSLGKQQLSQMGVLQALGINRKQLFAAKLIQSSLIMLFVLALALPLGAVLGYLLLKFVLPISFGWSMPMHFNWISTINMTVLVFIAVIVVSAISIAQITKKQVADLMKETL